MGMAASQARYLALVARKSNCEYEGQQINQARTALANQSANLFNQMLGLTVPVPPSTQDYTKTQYSFKDGFNASTISSWQQLAANADPEYNYVVTHYYNYNRYTGSQKMLTDPQVQINGNAGSISDAGLKTLTYYKQELNKANEAAAQALKAYNNARSATSNAELALQKVKDKYPGISNIATYQESDTYTGITDVVNDINNNYGFKYGSPATDATFVSYDNLNTYSRPDLQAQIDDTVEKLNALGFNYTNQDFYCCFDSGSESLIVLKSDLDALIAEENPATSLPVFHTSGTNSVADIIAGFDESAINELNAAQEALRQAQEAEQAAKEILDTATSDVSALEISYTTAKLAYESGSTFNYLGNCQLNYLEDLTTDQLAELKQVVADMKEQGIDASINKCFDENGNYMGGIYSFKMNGIIYYTTYDDLLSSYEGGSGNNNIDGQPKMPYYNATYVSTKVEKTEKALLETDGSGRFTSVRFENDTVTYSLEMETITDDKAYQDAMNQYYYDNAVYDKTVQDINAKTSLIKQEDLQLELRLKQLDTEQNALKTEMDAVKKVVDDNVDSTFKTFGG